MADGDQLSPQDVQDLQDIRKHMDPSDARGAKIDTLLKTANPATLQGAFQQRPKGPVQNANGPQPQTEKTDFENERQFSTGQKVVRGALTGGFEGLGVGTSEHPVRDLAKGALKFAKNIGTMATDPYSAESMDTAKTMFVDPRQKAVDASNARMDKQGFWNKVSGVAQRGLAEVPLVGTSLAGATEGLSHGIEAGDPEEAAHGAASGITQLASLAMMSKPGAKLADTAVHETAQATGIPQLATRALKSARETFGSQLSPAEAASTRAAGEFQPALKVTPQEVLQHAAQNGIELTPAQATRSKLQQGVQALGERSTVGGKGLEDALEANHAKFANSVGDFSRRVDPYAAGTSSEAAGETLQQSTKAAKDVAHENASNGYKQIDYLMPEKINAAPISSKWDTIKESLPMGAEDTIRNQVPRNMRAVVEDMLSGKPEGFQPTFEQGVKLRSFFRELGETEGLPNSQQAGFRQMSNAVDSAMESTANAKGSADQWRDANAGWRDYTSKYGDPKSPLTRISREMDPKKVTDSLLTRQSAKEIETLKGEGVSLDPLKSQVIDRIAKNGFIVKQGGLGGFSHSFLNTLFEPSELKELYVKGEIGRRINFNPNPSGTGGLHAVESQLTSPKKMLPIAGAARLSLPRNALGYIANNSTPSRLRISPGMMQSVMSALRQPANDQQ